VEPAHSHASFAEVLTQVGMQRDDLFHCQAIENGVVVDRVENLLGKAGEDRRPGGVNGAAEHGELGADRVFPHGNQRVAVSPGGRVGRQPEHALAKSGVHGAVGRCG